MHLAIYRDVKTFAVSHMHVLLAYFSCSEQDVPPHGRRRQQAAQLRRVPQGRQRQRMRAHPVRSRKLLLLLLLLMSL